MQLGFQTCTLIEIRAVITIKVPYRVKVPIKNFSQPSHKERQVCNSKIELPH